MDEIIEVTKKIGLFLAEAILVIYFCKQYVDKALGHINIGAGVKKQNKIDLDIIKKMDYYKEILNADRIILFEFHNGQHYSNYRNALRLSASYEVYKAGLESTIEKCSGIPIGVIPRFISAITNEGIAKCADTDDKNNDVTSVYEFKKSLNIGAFYDMAIHDRKGNIIGFVAVQWSEAMKDGFDTDSIEKLTWYLEECVNRLTEQDKKARKKRLFSKKK